MTHPLTPREKVARALSPKCWEFYDRHVDDPRMAAEIKHEVAPSLDATDAILTALATGSGDHAELARLADDLRKFEHHSVGSLKISMDEVRRIIAVCDAHAALLAENAALRSERDQIRSLHNRATDRSRHWEIASINADNRATEAGRKLAEAVGLLTRWLNTRGEMSGAGTVETATSTFLSKEDERG